MPHGKGRIGRMRPKRIEQNLALFGGEPTTCALKRRRAKKIFMPAWMAPDQRVTRAGPRFGIGRGHDAMPQGAGACIRMIVQDLSARDLCPQRIGQRRRRGAETREPSEAAAESASRAHSARSRQAALLGRSYPNARQDRRSRARRSARHFRRHWKRRRFPESRDHAPFAVERGRKIEIA